MAVKHSGRFLDDCLSSCIIRAKESAVVIASPQLTNEDLFLIRRFFGEDLGMSKIDFRVPEQKPFNRR